MNIQDAKKQVKDTVEAYLAKDEDGMYAIAPARQRPLFLIGAPGIGKTAIMEQIASELGIGLVSYSMTHHTRQSALGLPKIVHEQFEDLEYDASEYTMSEIIASLYSYMRETGLRRGILFLDEINCVSETLYPSMLQFLQFKTFGKHRVPDDWIVVCAGNPPEYNRSVHEFDIVTLDRLRKIEIEPEYAAWRAYAQETGIHPAISTYLEVKRDDFYSVETKPGSKAFVTARGWSDLSEVITLFEKLGKDVDLALISQFLQDNGVAERFAVYYDLFNKYRSDYQVDRILAGDMPAEIVERGQNADFDERIALVGLMLDTLETEMRGLVNEESLTIMLRDVLREAKQPILDGSNAVDVLQEVIADKEREIAQGGAVSSTPTQAMRLNIRLVEALKGLCALVTTERSPEGEAAFALISQSYAERVAGLEPASTHIEEMLANAYTYLDLAFGNDREALVFTAELTSRAVTSRYINRFGSPAYYAHNDNVLVDRHRQSLFARIDEAGLEAEDEK